MATITIEILEACTVAGEVRQVGEQLEVDEATGRQLINIGNAFEIVPEVEPDTVPLGGGGAGSVSGDFQTDFADLLAKPLTNATVIQVADGSYDIDSLAIMNRNDGHRLRILGNLADPSLCVLRCNISGVLFQNVRGVEFSGFTLEGALDHTLYGIQVGQNASVFTRQGSLIIKDCNVGAQLQGGRYTASRLQVLGCRDGINVEAGCGKFNEAVLAGLARDQGAGLRVSNQGELHAKAATIDLFSYGGQAAGGGALHCDGAQANDCYVGFYADAGGFVDNSEQGGALDCDYGFVAVHNATVKAVKSKAERCRRGFTAYYRGYLRASESSAIDADRYGYTVYGGGVIEAWQSRSNASGNNRDYLLRSGSLGSLNSMILYS